MSEEMKELYSELTAKSLGLVKTKNVDLDELSFILGISNERLMNIFDVKEEDFSLYLKMYSILKNW